MAASLCRDTRGHSPLCARLSGQGIVHSLVCVAGGGRVTDTAGLPPAEVFEDLYRLNTTTSTSLARVGSCVIVCVCQR